MLIVGSELEPIAVIVVMVEAVNFEKTDKNYTLKLKMVDLTYVLISFPPNIP